MAVSCVEEDADQHRQHHADDGDGLVLARQVGGRACWMAPAISCMRALPASCFRIQLR
jgi:hypothetical protein